MNRKEREKWQVAEYERVMASKRPPPTEGGGEDVLRIKPGENDALLWLRDKASGEEPHQVICKMPEIEGNVLTAREPFLLAWGLYWLLQKPEWRAKLINSAKEKLEQKVREAGMAKGDG